MYFKKMDISSVNIKKIINKLFSLNQFFEWRYFDKYHYNISD
jgi:hypothetical protein